VSCNDNNLTNVEYYGTISTADCEGVYNPFISGLLERAQTNTSSFQKLNNPDCIKEYATTLQIGRSDVILVSTSHNSNNSLLYSIYPSTYLSPYSGNMDPYFFDWICVDDNEYDGLPCTPRSAQGYASNWTLYNFPVEYCLSKIVDDPCQLQFNIYILLVVATCNLVKALIMTWMALRYKPSGFMTVGDAVASFLANPDPTTAGICMMSSRDIRRAEWKSTRPQLYSGTKKRWWRAVSRTEWWTSHTM
jgi:hypothetical protein